ncbi:hypothetical protein FNL55_09000 [Tardiphaga sp. vice352]|uniref:hypothetical protein n=2 Tax=Tardiphaga TaxID=1395974 RepID=UPI001165493A|nr:MULTISPECIES: hypothetical protein [unclassified Tardiphaga]QDM16141.1 hypothetical protein FNL53_09665 [Tardiphaga sp. vice278]QDM21167.1 hypothetical protein FIU28_08595 [Tardiphaga sp. vice154]QDM26350.1 hypothetical protein FNL56_09825 [Tardiphaga sp. vice304]QDM31418.1 hypothetical protein FNL55_09000 [Tardiphaga sp. vice352]
MTTLWDVGHLQDAARERQERMLQQQREADWAAAQCEVDRQICDANRGALYCPSRKCRRARRCLWRAPICAPLLLFQVSPARDRELTEQVYTQMQLTRRAAVTGRGGAS